MSSLDPMLLAKWTGGDWRFGFASVIRGVSVDTRTMRPGELFVAIKGQNFDGHDFVETAFEKGASGAVVSHADSLSYLKQPLLCVSNTLKALRDMAACYRTSVGPKVIAVTGSVGKTTVKEMTADVLSLKAPTARTRGNWNNEIGLPLSILSMEESAEIGVFEAGISHPGEMRILCDQLAPDWGMITSIGPVHLEYFDSVRAIAEEKSELLKSLPRGGKAVLRRDREWFNLLASRAPCDIITVAMRGDADYVCVLGSGRKSRMRVIEQSSGEFGDFNLPLPGKYIAENALFAVAAGRAHGLGWEDIAGAIESFKPQSMRWDIEIINGIKVINDAYNANPPGMAASVQAFFDSDIEGSGRKWLVLGGMRELGMFGEKAHVELGLNIGTGPWAGLITVGASGGMIADGAEKCGMERSRIFRCRDHSEAAATLKRVARPGDEALLKASRGDHLENVIAELKEL